MVMMDLGASYSDVRRKNLIANGLSIPATWPTVRSKFAEPGTAAQKRLKALEKEMGFEAPSMLTYAAPQMRQISRLQPKALSDRQSDVTANQVMFERRAVPKDR